MIVCIFYSWCGCRTVPDGCRPAPLRVGKMFDNAKHCKITHGRCIWSCGTRAEPVRPLTVSTLAVYGLFAGCPRAGAYVFCSKTALGQLGNSPYGLVNVMWHNINELPVRRHGAHVTSLLNNRLDRFSGWPRQGALSLTWVNLNPYMISDYNIYQVRDEITYTFPNFNAATWSLEWICNFITNFILGMWLLTLPQ